MKKASARLLLSAAALCFGASACGGPSQRLDQARDLALSGHYRPALLEARAILFSLGSERSDKVDAVRRDALKLAGDLCALHLDDPRCAAREYRELIKRFPTSHEAFEARERLGDLDLRTGDARAAIEAWRDQVAAAPDRPGADQAQLKITRAWVDLGNLNEARLAASELQSRWPGSKLAASAALLAASTFHLEGRHAEAARAYARVAEQFRGTAQGADALFEQGNCLAELGDDAHAAQAFTQALVRHDAPDVVQYALERSQHRLDLARAVDPRNLGAVFDRGIPRPVRIARVSRTSGSSRR
jgi:TolA-binding protein